MSGEIEDEVDWDWDDIKTFDKSSQRSTFKISRVFFKKRYIHLRLDPTDSNRNNRRIAFPFTLDFSQESYYRVSMAFTSSKVAY